MNIQTAIIFLLMSLPSYMQAQAGYEPDTPEENTYGQSTLPSRLAIVRENKQQAFPKSVPAGNYSGITYMGNNRYAVVNDKSVADGFVVFNIQIDSISGSILDVEYEGFKSAGSPNRDMEGIAFFPSDSTLFICGEKDNRILEYTQNGEYTGRELKLPACFAAASQNYGLESLTYNARTGRFWTTSESTLPADGEQASYNNKVCNRLRLQSFTNDMQPAEQYFYEMDQPVAKSNADNYAMGVSDLCALDDGRVLVLEREFFVAKNKLGSFVNCKLYVVNPGEELPGSLLRKTELLQFKTSLTLFQFGLANYEGMCLGPKLSDGNRVLIMISDSQNQYKGVLKDWFKTIVIDCN